MRYRGFFCSTGFLSSENYEVLLLWASFREPLFEPHVGTGVPTYHVPRVHLRCGGSRLSHVTLEPMGARAVVFADTRC